MSKRNNSNSNLNKVTPMQVRIRLLTFLALSCLVGYGLLYLDQNNEVIVYFTDPLKFCCFGIIVFCVYLVLFADTANEEKQIKSSGYFKELIKAVAGIAIIAGILQIP